MLLDIPSRSVSWRFCSTVVYCVNIRAREALSADLQRISQFIAHRNDDDEIGYNASNVPLRNNVYKKEYIKRSSSHCIGMKLKVSNISF